MHRKKKVACLLLSIGIIVFLGEVISRTYLTIKKEANFFMPASQYPAYTYYPELQQLDQYQTSEDTFDILFLGGSVLNQTTQFFPKDTLRILQSLVPQKKLNILNLAILAHSSLDSYYKYSLINNKRFDLVILYHGINEVRANNIPKSKYKKDYSHYAYYKKINFSFQKSIFGSKFFILPNTLNNFVVDLDQKYLSPDDYVPEHIPKRKYRLYGLNVKSAQSYRNNILNIIDLSKKRKEPILIMSFAYCRKINAFKCPNKRMTNIWGQPENVERGLRVHNSIIRKIANTNADVIYLDQDARMKSRSEFFTDICHFSKQGNTFFVRSIADKLKTIL